VFSLHDRIGVPGEIIERVHFIGALPELSKYL
jgi:hypothetical protein